jgi:hypothetical protein
VTVCALTVDFGDNLSAFWSALVAVCPSVVGADSPASSLVEDGELEGCCSDESGDFAVAPAEDSELGEDADSEELD